MMRMLVCLVVQTRSAARDAAVVARGDLAAGDGEPDAVPGVVEVALEVPDSFRALGLGACGRVPCPHGELVDGGIEREFGLREPPCPRVVSLEYSRCREARAVVE